VRVTADDKKRVVLPTSQPGESFDLQIPSDGIFVLTRLSAAAAPSKVRLEKRDGFTVGVIDHPISEEALKEALGNFP